MNTRREIQFIYDYVSSRSYPLQEEKKIVTRDQGTDQRQNVMGTGNLLTHACQF